MINPCEICILRPVGCRKGCHYLIEYLKECLDNKHYSKNSYEFIADRLKEGRAEFFDDDKEFRYVFSSPLR